MRIAAANPSYAKRDVQRIVSANRFTELVSHSRSIGQDLFNRGKPATLTANRGDEQLLQAWPNMFRQRVAPRNVDSHVQRAAQRCAYARMYVRQQTTRIFRRGKIYCQIFYL